MARQCNGIRAMASLLSDIRHEPNGIISCCRREAESKPGETVNGESSTLQTNNTLCRRVRGVHDRQQINSIITPPSISTLQPSQNALNARDLIHRNQLRLNIAIILDKAMPKQCPAVTHFVHFQMTFTFDKPTAKIEKRMPLDCTTKRTCLKTSWKPGA